MVSHLKTMYEAEHPALILRSSSTGSYGSGLERPVWDKEGPEQRAVGVAWAHVVAWVACAPVSPRELPGQEGERVGTLDGTDPLTGRDGRG